MSVSDKIAKLDRQIENYNDSYGCTLESLVAHKKRFIQTQSDMKRAEWKKAHKIAKANRKYYRRLYDSYGNRTHTSEGDTLYDQWGTHYTQCMYGEIPYILKKLRDALEIRNNYTKCL